MHAHGVHTCMQAKLIHIKSLNQSISQSVFKRKPLKFKRAAIIGLWVIDKVKEEMFKEGCNGSTRRMGDLGASGGGVSWEHLEEGCPGSIQRMGDLGVPGAEVLWEHPEEGVPWEHLEHGCSGSIWRSWDACDQTTLLICMKLSKNT